MRMEDRAKLADIYSRQPMPVDRLPYTANFDAIVDAFNEGRPVPLTHARVWDSLILIRKSGGLPKKGA